MSSGWTARCASRRADDDALVETAPHNVERDPERVELPGDAITLVADRWVPARASRGVLVLLPGGGQTRHSWDASARQLAGAGWTVYTLDPRGHGESDWAPRPAADYGVVAHAADLAAVLGRIVERDSGWLALVGASMGGMTAMQYAASHPGAVGAIVLVDITPSVEAAGVERIRSFMSRGKAGFDSMDEVLDAVAAYRPGAPRRPPESLRHNVRRGSDGRYYWHWDPEFHRPDNGLADREANRRRLLEAAASIDVPALVVRGGTSDVVSDAGVAELLAVLPHGEGRSLPDAGHMVVGDDNDAFVGEVLSFLDAVAPST
jgi:pimeloyl-ACP methyl ester carboxylesterase